MKSEERRKEKEVKSFRKGALLGLIALSVIAFLMFGLPALTPKPADQQLVQHDHVRLEYFVNGERELLPANIGIDDPLYKDHSLDQYSPLSIAPLHTHDDTGVIHVESNRQRDYTFGEFLKVWGVQYDSLTLCEATQTGMLQDPRDGCKPISDYENYVLKNNDNLVLQVND